jgi:mannitol-specific phosphotransferase system IIBC component
MNPRTENETDVYNMISYSIIEGAQTGLLVAPVILLADIAANPPFITRIAIASLLPSVLACIIGCVTFALVMIGLLAKAIIQSLIPIVLLISSKAFIEAVVTVFKSSGIACCLLVLPRLTDRQARFFKTVDEMSAMGEQHCEDDRRANDVSQQQEEDNRTRSVSGSSSRSRSRGSYRSRSRGSYRNNNVDNTEPCNGSSD